MNQTLTAILLAGGSGSRIGTEVPKQFLHLHDLPLALYSYRALLETSIIQDIVVVCHEEYYPLFTQEVKPVRFAEPGPRRQDSVRSGLEKAQGEYVCVHDSARPFISSKLIEQVCLASLETGAAVVGVPAKSTIKTASPEGYVEKTLNRSSLWEIQTPQVIKRSILETGFKKITETVTDDVSIAEKLGIDVKLVEGSYSNIKVTTMEDFAIAKVLLENAHAQI